MMLVLVELFFAIKQHGTTCACNTARRAAFIGVLAVLFAEGHKLRQVVGHFFESRLPPRLRRVPLPVAPCGLPL